MKTRLAIIALLFCAVTVIAIIVRGQATFTQGVGTYTIATLPTTPGLGTIAIITDGKGNSCTSGGGINYVLCIYNGSTWMTLIGARISVTTSSIGGGLLLSGTCASTTVSATNAIVGMYVEVTPLTDPGAGFWWQGFVSSSDTVTVRVCTPIAGTPVASQYKVKVN